MPMDPMDPPRWKQWSIVHGHFLDMGGFTVVDPSHENDDPKDGSQNGQVLTFDEYKTLEGFSLPTLTKDEINDRSKAPGLTRILAFLQLVWFLVQCIARRTQRLVLTELELVTAALAAINFFTFVVWLNKPLDVKQPFRVYFAKRMTEQSSAGHPQGEPQEVPQEVPVRVLFPSTFQS